MLKVGWIVPQRIITKFERMKPYEKYKESGVEWVGKIPKNWQFVKLKQLVSCNDETLTIRDNDNFFINYIEIGDVNLEKGIANYSNVHIQEAPSRARRIVKANDIIISTVRTYLKAIAKVPEEYNDFIASTGFAILRAKAIDYSFLNFVVQNEDFINEVISLSVGASYPAISSNNLINIKVALPTLEEQTAIANYLDHQTAIIDELIEKKTKQIALLKEKRQAIINETVTKGLDPTAKMKDSRVEWLGEIPESWEVVKLKRFVKEHRQGFYSSNGYDNFGFKVARITDIKDNNILDITDSPYYDLPESEVKDFILKDGDFLFQRTGAHKKIGIFKGNQPAIYGSFLIRFRFNEKKINPDFLLMYFDSYVYQNQLNSTIHGGANPNIHAENIKECIVVVPSKEEQELMFKAYVKERDNIILLSEKFQHQIEKLKEYRQSLISEAVTGKIDVRGWQL